jgi:hypothetical protein
MNQLETAARHGRLDTVNRLLQDPRVDPSANDNLAIRWAARHGHLDVMNRLLQDPRVDPSAKDNETIRYIFASNGRLDVVNRLLQDPRVDPSDNDNYAIRRAAENGHLDVVAVLYRVVNHTGFDKEKKLMTWEQERKQKTMEWAHIVTRLACDHSTWATRLPVELKTEIVMTAFGNEVVVARPQEQVMRRGCVLVRKCLDLRSIEIS